MPSLAGLVLAAAVTATFQPSSPSVGDLITIQFEAPVALESSPDYEVVSQHENRVVVRTFRPAPFVLHGVAGATRFQNLVVPVRSVLNPNEPMTPAPLVPPREVPHPRTPLVAITAAAVIALALWLLVWWRTRPRHGAEPARVSPEGRFRGAVEALRSRSDGARWAELADETRRYLSATRAAIGSELTTRELVARLGRERRVVEEILRQGDLEKFSTQGAVPLSFNEVAARAVGLLDLGDDPGEAAS